MTTVPQGELFRILARTRPRRATNIAHEVRQHGDIETNNTTAHPQQGTTETCITSAPENCTKNARFSPAKAMAVSIPHRHQRAKAIGVSDKRPTWPTGPGGGARGRRRGLARRPVGGQCYKRVKPTRFQSPRENPCYKRRQSKPKNHHYQRKSPQIDDVRNNGSEIHTKNTLD